MTNTTCASDLHVCSLMTDRFQSGRTPGNTSQVSFWSTWSPRHLITPRVQLKRQESKTLTKPLFCLAWEVGFVWKELKDDMTTGSSRADVGWGDRDIINHSARRAAGSCRQRGTAFLRHAPRCLRAATTQLHQLRIVSSFFHGILHFQTALSPSCWQTPSAVSQMSL